MRSSGPDRYTFPWTDDCICKVLCCVTSLVAVIFTAVDPGTIIFLIMQNNFNRRGTSDISSYQSRIIARQKSCLGIFIAKCKLQRFTVGSRRLRGEAIQSRGNANQATSVQFLPRKKPSSCFCINAFSTFLSFSLRSLSL